MKNRVLDNITNKIKITYNYDDIKIKEIRYGLESLYLSIFKLIVVIIISIIFGTYKELLLFILTYGILRIFAFGAHAKRNIDCWVYSLLFFSVIPYLIKVLFLKAYLYNLLSILFSILLIIYSPADTEKRPLIHKKKRVMYKIVVSIISIVYIILIIKNQNIYIKNLLMFSIIMETLLVLPITYKILGVKYNNYKLYKRKEDKKWNY